MITKASALIFPNRLALMPPSTLAHVRVCGFLKERLFSRLKSEVKRTTDPQAEMDRAAKRADYFAAGTRVVWDVDLLSDNSVRVYRSSNPNTPTLYHRGEIAEADPAVPGWTMAVDDLFV